MRKGPGKWAASGTVVRAIGEKKDIRQETCHRALGDLVHRGKIPTFELDGLVAFQQGHHIFGAQHVIAMLAHPDDRVLLSERGKSGMCVLPQPKRVDQRCFDRKCRCLFHDIRP